MKLRAVLLLSLTGLILAVAAYSRQAGSGLLVLEWASKASAEKPPVAVLIEMGRKDAKATPWAGTATVAGATVVNREGYRFRDGDSLKDPNGWDAKSHRAQGAAKKNPAQAALEGAASVGVVLHLADVKPDATLTVAAGQGRDAVAVPLAAVLTGKPFPLWNGNAVVRLVSTATPVVMEKTEDSFPAAAYGPDGTLWVAYISYTLKHEDQRVQAAQLPEQPKDFQGFVQTEFGDQLWVKSYRDGKWSAPIAVTDPRQDLVGCAVAVESDGTVWVAYSANRDGKHDLLARPIAASKVGAEERLAGGDMSHLHPVACTDRSGHVRVLCQSRLLKGASVISSWRRAEGKWTAGPASGTAGPSWYPFAAAGPNGEVAQAFDGYRDGDYDIFVTTETAKETKADTAIASTARFESRPSAAYDVQGRLWIAYEEGPEQWGKNFGALDDSGGSPLYSGRTVKVVCLQDGKLVQPAASLPALATREKPPEGVGPVNEGQVRYSHPQVGIDGKGRIWLTYVKKGGTRASTKLGSYWLTIARRLDGDHWSEPIEVHHSDGMMDPRPVLLPHPAGGLRIVHHADGRFTTPDNAGSNQIYMSYLDLPGEPVEPKLVPHDAGTKDAKTLAKAKAEREGVAHIRAARVDVAGKKHRLLRGEFHRHTEVSSDGGADGSLGDMYRYAADAADMDWIGNADHDNGNGREYTWWLTQKYNDAYFVAERFTPMFSYERSVPYPHGHRNCIFAKRGIRTLPRLAAKDAASAVANIHADDAKMLYRYLHELDGLCASHTSATTMGTDWRDNDPVVEPIVEIYQGDRNNYEMEGAPRAGYDAKSGKKPIQIAGWHPDGFVDVAMNKKGYKFGFQSSSDHISTHISYCIVLAEKHDRDSILTGLKKRHCYGATEDIVLEVKSGDHVMGDEFKTAAAPSLQIRVGGTNDVKTVEILKDSKVVDTLKGSGRDFASQWTDPSPTEGTHYYYVRVTQADGELAWGSPMWIHYAK